MKKENRTVSQRLDKFLESSQRKSYFVVFVTFVFLLMFLLFAVIPAFASVFAKNEENAVIAGETRKAKDKLTTFGLLVAQKEQKQNLLTFFNTVFSEDNPQTKSIEYIYEAAEVTNVFIRSAQFPESYKRPRILAVDFPGVSPQVVPAYIILSIEGDRQNIYDYIKNLEEKRLIFNFLRVGISRKTDKALETTNDRGEFTAQLEIEYFYYDITKVAK